MSEEPLDISKAFLGPERNKRIAIAVVALFALAATAWGVGSAIPILGCATSFLGIAIALIFGLQTSWFGRPVTSTTRMAAVSLFASLTICTCSGGFSRFRNEQIESGARAQRELDQMIADSNTADAVPGSALDAGNIPPETAPRLQQASDTGAAAAPLAQLPQAPATDPGTSASNASQLPRSLTSGAVDNAAFDALLHGNEWAFFQNGVRSCSREEEPSLLPPGDNEFQRRAAAANRPQIIASIEGRVVRFSATGTLHGTDNVFDTLSLGSSGGPFEPFEVHRSPYDFSRNQLTFHIVANSDQSPSAMLGGSTGANWALCRRGACSPDIRASTYSSEVMRTIGRVDGRDVQVADRDVDVEWQNFSRLAIPVAMPEVEASRYATSMPISVVMYLKFIGLGFHQRCQRSCDVMFGERMCDSSDNGMGIFKKSELLAYEVRVGNQVVAEFIGEGLGD